jgi:hypothetical protein
VFIQAFNSILPSLEAIQATLPCHVWQRSSQILTPYLHLVSVSYLYRSILYIYIYIYIYIPSTSKFLPRVLHITCISTVLHSKGLVFNGAPDILVARLEANIPLVALVSVYVYLVFSSLCPCDGLIPGPRTATDCIQD